MNSMIRWIVTLASLSTFSSFSAAQKVFEQDIRMNEAGAAAACKAYAEAQEIYHRTDYDGDGILEYAQTLKGGEDGVIVQPSKLDASELPKPSEKEHQTIDGLLANLASDIPSVRENAMADLTDLGAVAIGAVQNTQKTTQDLEVSLRCLKIIDSYRVPFSQQVFDSRHGLFTHPSDQGHPRPGPKYGNLGLIDKAFAEAECLFGSDATKAKPKAGYLFRILMRQGKDAPGGRKNYIVAGNMTRGYALLAFPKEYGGTGRKVFMISHAGSVFERDFGSLENTNNFVNKCVEFNPDKQWKLTH